MGLIIFSCGFMEEEDWARLVMLGGMQVEEVVARLYRGMLPTWSQQAQVEEEVQLVVGLLSPTLEEEEAALLA